MFFNPFKYLIMSIAPLASLGFSALAGAGAFGLSKLRKSKPKQFTPNITPFSTLTDIPTGEGLNQQILAGLRGEGVGFPKGFGERVTSPLVAQRRADLPQERQEVSDIFAGRGLGRSSLAGREEGRVVSQANRDINQILAEQALRGELQKKQDIQNIQNRALQFTQAEAGQRNIASQFDAGIGQANLQAQNLAQQQQRDIEIGLPLAAAGGTLQALSGFNIQDLLAERNARKASAFRGLGALGGVA